MASELLPQIQQGLNALFPLLIFAGMWWLLRDVIKLAIALALNRPIALPSIPLPPAKPAAVEPETAPRPVEPPQKPDSGPSKPVPSVAPPPSGAPPWYVLATHEIGFHEVGDNQGIERYIALAHTGALGDPWCAIFANAMLESAGVPGSRSPSSQSFRTHPAFVQLQQPALGCLVVFWRGSKSSGLGHVAFYGGENSTHIWSLGGNESDMVQDEALPKDSASFGLIGYWWPKSIPLPTGGPIILPPGTPTSIKTPGGVPDLPSGPAAPPVHPLVSGNVVKGKMSIFGGPTDTGMEPGEGLALIDSSQIAQFPGLFLAESPPGTTGLGRRLDPKSYYLAMRWRYEETSKATLRRIKVQVTANGKTFEAQPVDWGPNVNTGRIADLSPGLASALGLKTDDVVEITIPQAVPAVT